MKQILFFLLTIPFYPVHGQETKKQKEQNKTSIGFNFSPDYSFRTLKNNDGSATAGFIIKSRNDIEIAKFGYTTGLNVCINFAGLVELETGIQYSNKGYKTKKQDLIFAPPPTPGVPTKAKFTYSYQYIGVPLKAKFMMGNGKLRFFSGIGFMANFLLRARQTTFLEYADGNTDKKKQSATESFKKIDISPMISFGIDYTITKKIHLIAEPTFRYGVIKTKDAPIAEYLWSAGLNMALYYRLK